MCFGIQIPWQLLHSLCKVSVFSVPVLLKYPHSLHLHVVSKFDLFLGPRPAPARKSFHWWWWSEAEYEEQLHGDGGMDDGRVQVLKQILLIRGSQVFGPRATFS